MMQHSHSIDEDLTSFYMTWISQYEANNTLHITCRIGPCRFASDYIYIEGAVSMSNNTDIWTIEYDPAFLKLYNEQQEAFKYEFKSSDRWKCSARVANKTLIGVSFPSRIIVKVLLHSHLNPIDNGKLFIDYPIINLVNLLYFILYTFICKHYTVYIMLDALYTDRLVYSFFHILQSLLLQQKQ